MSEKITDATLASEKCLEVIRPSLLALRKIIYENSDRGEYALAIYAQCENKLHEICFQLESTRDSMNKLTEITDSMRKANEMNAGAAFGSGVGYKTTTTKN